MVEERRQAQRIAAVEDVAHDVRVHNAVGEREADTGDGFGMAVDDAPAPRLVAGEIGGVEGEAAPPAVSPLQRTDEGFVAKHECGRDLAGAQQILRAVDVIENGGEQPGALDQRDLEPPPFLGAEDQRHEIDLPGLVERGGFGEQVLGDAVLAHKPPELVRPGALLFAVELTEVVQKGLPMRTDAAVAVNHLVKVAGNRRVTGGRVAASGLDAFGLCHHILRDNP